MYNQQPVGQFKLNVCTNLPCQLRNGETALQHLAWAGYDGAELAALPQMADHVQTGQGREYAGRIRRTAADLGLALYAIEAASARS